MKPKPTTKKKLNTGKIHRSHFYPASDNWFPNYPGDLVKVSLSETKHKNSTTFTVSITGNDDFGMYLYVQAPKGNFRNPQFPQCPTSHELLLELLDIIDNKMPDKISQSWCLEQGFVRD